MSQSIEVVNRFLKAFEPSQGFRTALGEFMTEGCVYENVGLTYSTGPEEALTVMQGFVDELGFDHFNVKMLAAIASGDTVMTERIDDLCDAGGNVLASLRLMGIFQVKGGKIAAWRDYFDTAPFKS